MGYIKQKFLENIPSKEVDVLLQKYERKSTNTKPKTKVVPELNEEQLKMLDEIIDCQIEDAKIRRSGGEW